ncbi:MAG: hypothetical protein HY914_10540 [Desulfomonile tiedjei]|nr:hypothetical protein [Desulfomonile tiedjei]
MEQEPKICTNILKIIHARSESGQLVRVEEILAELKEQGFLESEDVEQKAHLETTLKQVLKENRDLKAISGKNGIPYYYSAQSLSETYAGILVRKSENPLWLIAEVVRENSQLYPRPVPVDSFLEPPFGLTREEIAECLTTMREQREYQDIARTITSVGTPFLYSTQHLDPDHAFTLAEWLDVGQVNNP